MKEQSLNHNLLGWTKMTLIQTLKSKTKMFRFIIKDSLIISLTTLITRMRIVSQMNNKKWGGLKRKKTLWQEFIVSAEESNYSLGTFTNREEIWMILMSILLEFRNDRKCSLTRSQVPRLSNNDLTNSGTTISYLLISSINRIWRRSKT